MCILDFLSKHFVNVLYPEQHFDSEGQSEATRTLVSHFSGVGMDGCFAK
jgi:hypothetical protein